jgi:hypothetical protein
MYFKQAYGETKLVIDVILSIQVPTATTIVPKLYILCGVALVVLVLHKGVTY